MSQTLIDPAPLSTELAPREAARYPLSWGQRALWFLERLAPGNPAYVIAGAGRVLGGLDEPALRRALDRLVARHPALRTTFRESGGEVWQVVAATGGWEEGGGGAAAFRPFDLTTGPLVRLGLDRSPAGTVITLAVHHIVSDFWSLGVMLRDLGALYEEERGGEPAALEPLAASYGEWARDQVERMAGEEGEALWSFWRGRLAEVPTVLELPADRPRPAVQSFRGGSVALRVEKGLADAVRRLGRRQGATPAVTLLAAFAALLHRYTGQEQLLVGMPTTGRRSPEVAGLVGFLVNPVAIPCDLRGAPGFGELLGRVRESALAAFDHQDYPLAELAERLQPERDASRSPLFQVSFVLQKGRRAGEEGIAALSVGETGARLALGGPGGLELETVELAEPGAQFDLAVAAAELPGEHGTELVSRWQYDRDLFDRPTIARLAAHYRRLLAAVVAEPELEIGELPLLDPAERAQLLSEWAGDPEIAGDGGRLEEPFFARAARHPEAMALVDGERTWTYGELAARAEGLAARLRALGVGPEVPVGVCGRRSGDLVAAMLGILRSGGAYVPLDPAYPAERLRSTLLDSGAPVLVTDAAGLVPEYEGIRVGLDEALPAGPPPASLPESLAYLIYTSGSTGRPKGVAITHRSARAYARWARSRYSDRELAGVLAATSICFDISTFEIFTPLSCGGTVVLAEHALDLPRLAARWPVTLIDTVPSAMGELVRAGAVPPTVTTVNLAGEPLRHSLVAEVYRGTLANRVINCYGPTEDTTFSTVREVGRGETVEPTLGRPIAGGRGYLLDRELRPVPLGVPGELYLGGAGLARGYFGRPDLTAERFVPDGQSGLPGERLYRTGDLIRYRADGDLLYLGRLDHQVKVRGFRIELGEIEALLRRAPGVRDAVVVVRGSGADRRLAAFVEAAGVTSQALRALLAERLPAFMVPAAIQVLPALPRTPNGKVDREALPAEEREEGAAEAAPPRTSTEAFLAALWSDLLELERVGVHDHFFRLGGHSLLALRAASRVRAELGVEVPLQRFFDTPTVAGLAAAIDASRQAELPPLPRHGGDAAPLTGSQEQLWFLDRLEPGNPVYNLAGGLRLRGTLDSSRLAAALGAIAARHDALRTTFGEVAGRPFQRVWPAGRVPLPRVDLTAVPGGELDRLLRQEARRAFDLERGPLWRFVLFARAPGDHTLSVCLHHIVGDGGSLGIFARELAAFYAGSSLPPLPARFADYAAWQQGRQAGAWMEGELDWWRAQLAGVPQGLELPADRQRSAASGRGGWVAAELPPALAAGVRGLARQEGTTPFVVLLAAFELLLGRTTGQDDFLVGAPLAARGRPELEGLIGFFVNTLPIRADLTAEPGFRELVARTRERLAGTLEHGEVPYAKLVETLAPDRSTPLLQAVLAFQQSPWQAFSLPGLGAALAPQGTGTAKFDLSLSLEAQGDRLAGFWEYSRDLFDRATVQRWDGRFQALLQAALAAPEQGIGELSGLTAAEAHQVGREWRGTSTAYPRESTVHGLFAEQAAATPDRVALVDGDRQWSYRALDAWACRLARDLAALGIAADRPVGLVLGRSPEVIAANLAVLKAGAAYLPIDPGYPLDRIAALLADAGEAGAPAPFLVSAGRPDLAAWAAEQGLRALVVDDRQGSPAEHPPVPPAGHPDSLAYVMYTSGSTGRPKGVGTVHRGVVRLLCDTGYARFLAEEVFLQLAALSFDPATFEIYGPLLHGGRLVLAPPGVPSMRGLGELLKTHGVTTLWLTTGLFHQMVEDGLEELDGLCQLLAGGDVLSVAHVRRVARRFPELRLVNGYGPTEGTTFTTCWRVAESQLGATVSIGVPIANTEVHVLDARLQPLPVGVVGELWIGGDGLARGYLGRPELTAERFAPDPAGGPGDRLYRSGDRVRWLADGRLEFLGRLDRQVKIRGYRIEPGEVEAALAAHPAVAEAAVVVQEGPAGKRLVGYAGTGGAPLTAEDLTEWLRERLPEPMVPALLMVLERLPLNANGKVDRRALPAPVERAGTGFVPPRTPAERQLASIWSGLLGIERVGAEADFFQLGGHSLLALQLVSRVREQLGVELPLQDLFAAPTLAAVARAVESAQAAVLPPIAALPRTGEAFPLSWAQERLWFLSRYDPATPLYNIAGGLRLQGELEVAALAAGLSEIERRHESLRTRFEESGGLPLQRILPPAGWPLPRVDLAALAPDVRESEGRRLAAREELRPFDLERGRLLRALLLRLDADEHVLLLTLHHVISDGWSIAVLAGELSQRYSGDSRPAELPVQYADFAVWQRSWLAGGRLEGLLAHWETELAGAPRVLSLPGDRPVSRERRHRGALARFPLPGVETLARSRQATPFMVFLAAFETLLVRWSGQEDLLVGVPVAGRDRREIEGLIGFFVNTLVLRGDLAAHPAFGELVAATRERALRAFAHQELPFVKLVEALHPERDGGHAPLVQVLFALEETAWQEVRLPGLTLAPLETATGLARFDLTLTVGLRDGGWQGSWEYDRDLFDAATVARLGGHLAELLTAALADPGRSIAELPLLTAAERQQLREWNATRIEAPGRPLLERFWKQARQTPGAVAVASRSGSWSYAELAGRVASLAARLRGLGAGPEVLVGLCAGRTVELVIGALAIVESGAAYVPLDPTYPAERLALTLEDCRAPLLVTQRGVAERLAGFTGERVFLEDSAETAVPEPSRSEIPDSLAWVIYTSGSTGRPKGVAITRRSAGAFLDWALASYTPAELAGVLGSTSVNFDMSIFELFVPLSMGGAVVMVENALELARWDAEDWPVTLVNTVPSAMSELVRLGGVPATVATVNLGGEPLRRELADEVYARTSARRLLNAYGPTEDTTFSTVSEVPQGQTGEPTLGRPLTGSRGYVIDRMGALAPMGVPGELYLAGAGLARGYLGRPALTAERFLPDPWSGLSGARAYRVGDLVRLRPDGDLAYLGRLDFQVKLRGFRVELGEIEAALGAQPGIRRALVTADGEGAEARLVAYLETAAALDEAALRRALSARLPEYMVPGAFVALAAFPRLPNGKIDRAALPAPLRRPRGQGLAPRNPLEELLAGLWAEVLGLERVGVEDDFFELGGHSLLATRLVSRIQSTLGVALSLPRLFEHPTVAAVADLVRQAGAALSPPPPLFPVPRDRDLPLSFAQERLWFLDRLEPGNGAYHIAGAVHLAGPLASGLLARGLAALTARHEALRTTFAEGADGPEQRIAAAAEIPLPVVDLAALPPAPPGMRAESDRLARAEARRPFDLGRGPLLRALLLRSGAADHTLVLTMHHIVSDGWSLGVLVRDLSAAVAAFARSETPAWPPLPLQYGDYAVWQRRTLTPELLSREVDFWRAELAGAPRVLELPADHRRPVLQSGEGRVVRLCLGREAGAAVDRLAAGSGATRFMVLLALFFTLLRRWTGQDDLLVGSPVANRGRQELEGLIGFFVNTLVLRADFREGPAGRPSFRQLLERVRERALAAYGHQALPFDRLVQELETERDLSRTPLVQHLFALQNTPQETLVLPGLAVTPRPLFNDTAKFDLTLAFEDDPALTGWIEYATALFDRATAERFGRHFARLLGAAAAAPETAVTALPLLDAAERQELLSVGEGGPSRTLDLLPDFRREGTAVVCGAERLSYRELGERVEETAARLAGLGIGSGDLIGVQLERSPELIATLLAVVTLGAAYLPLDPAYPAERLSRMLADAGVAALVTAEGIARQPAPGGSWGGERMYVIYTSGSTGIPKGAVVYRTGFANLLSWFVTEFGWDATDRALVISSPSFDLTQKNFFAPLLAGGTLYLGPVDYDPAALAATIEREGITRLNGTPSAFYPIVEAGRPLASLRSAFLGGEQIDPDRLGTLRDRVVNTYGPTECSDVVTFHRLEAGEESAPLGRPVPGVLLRVVDEELELAPTGVAGELLLGGICVGAGYPGDAALTAEKFLPDPWSGLPGERLYRTGDRVRFRGDFEYLGRMDQQVKLRGFRIEPGEIEAVLRRHPAVREAAVVVKGSGGDARLAAFWVRDPAAGTAAPAGLRSHVRESLPDYMVPALYAELPALPLTPSGKVDRRVLLALEIAPSGEGPRDERPATATEAAVAAIWAEVLGHPPGLDADFFASGGHSLLAARVITRLRQQLGVELPVRALFEAPTVELLAARVERTGAVYMGEAPLQPVARRRALPLSFAQERLWFLDRIEAGAVYNVPGALRLSGPLQAGFLARSLDRVVRRHESLRTTFAVADLQPVQVVAAEPEARLGVVDLAALPGERREAAVRGLAAAEAARPFDLARGPLLRAVLLVLAPAEHVLLLTLHHIVSDGWSMGILIHELAAGYRAFQEGREPAFPALPIQYPDFAVWQRRWLQGEALAARLAYWRGQLGDLPAVLALPSDRPRPRVQSYRGASRPFRIPAGDAAALRRLGRSEGATLFMVLLAAWQALLARLTGQPALAVGSPVAGRDRQELEGLIGFFVNLLVLRGDVTGAPTFTELVRRVRGTVLGAFENQEVPFDKLVEELQPLRDPGHSPLFQVLFVLQNDLHEPLRLPGIELARVPVAGRVSRYDLSLSVADAAGGAGAVGDCADLMGALEFSTDLFDAATVERWLGDFQALLASAAASPGLPWLELPLVQPGERHQILVEWNASPRPPLALGFEAAWCEHPRCRPDAVALVLGDMQLSYRRLEAEVACQAARFRSAGVGPDRLVALHLDRSFEMVASALAVLRAGGGYLPLDVGLPADRLAFVLADARPALLVTRGRWRPDLPPFAGPVLDVEADSAPEPGPEAAAVPDSATAYVIYTSGSTGTPKGSVISRGALDNLTRHCAADFGARDVTLAKASLSFDVSLLALFVPLALGARVVLMAAGTERDLAAMARLAADQQVTTLGFTPSAFLGFLAQEESRACHSIRRWTSGAEAFPPDLLEQLFSRFPGTELRNIYGPTETTVYVSSWTCSPEDGDRPIPIGRPHVGAGLYLVDAGFSVLPVGVPGELCVGGAGLARGYLRRPDLTAEKFIPHPFARAAGERLYRTGDLARLRSDGALEFLGRIDHQVKIRGFRVELGEIEAALGSHPGVHDAVVVVRGEDRLLACIVARDPADPPAPAELTAFAAERLPGYMVPGLFALLPQLPLLATGKVDRAALARLSAEQIEGREAAGGFVAPQTPVEEAIAAIWAEVLGIDPVRQPLGIRDDFFALGGHSLLAIQVLLQVQRAFSVELPVKALFENPTIEGVALAVAEQLTAGIDDAEMLQLLAELG